jgi:hypothetical protein
MNDLGRVSDAFGLAGEVILTALMLTQSCSLALNRAYLLVDTSGKLLSEWTIYRLCTGHTSVETFHMM